MIDEQERAKWLSMQQQVLPFDFWEEEKKAEKAKLQEEQETEQKRLEAIMTALRWYDDPDTDNKKLMNLQWEYKHGNVEALEKIYELSREICIKFIHAIGKHNRHVRNLSWEDKKIKAADAASYLIEQYITRPDFIAEKNVPGYLFLRVQHELFYQRKIDEIVDFVDLLAFFKEGEEDEIREDEK